MADSDLKQKTISGMLWSGIGRIGTVGISFISNIVLARLLMPDDFGCIGMLYVFIAISSIFISGGLGQALIQKKEPTHIDYTTVFYWNLVMSLIFYVILFFSAPAIASFYDIPLLKYFAEPLLCGISESSPAYDKAQSLLQFLAHIRALRPAEIAAIPPTSIMREFIGGQTL